VARPNWVSPQTLMQSLTTVVCALTGVGLGLAVANRPRFWWQDCLHNYAAFWIFPAFILGFFYLAQLRSTRRLLVASIAAACGYLYAATFMIVRAWPYIKVQAAAPVHHQQESRDLQIAWIDRWSATDDPLALADLVMRHAPTVLIVSGVAHERLQAAIPQATYPHRQQLRDELQREISIFSAVPLASESLLTLGVNASVGGVVRVVATPTQQIQLGVLALEYSRDRQSFERNRISSRRLSAQIRNSTLSRVVVGDFCATPFSQLVAVFPEQARVSPLRTQHGVFEFVTRVATNAWDAPAAVFVSKDLRGGNNRASLIRELLLPGRARPGLVFDVSVGKEGSGSILPQ
jgi:hypothetical protein